MSEENKKLHVQVPTKIVRNEDIFLNNSEFLLYTRLCFLYFRNYKHEEIELDHKKLMKFADIRDTRTFKNKLNKLHKLGLIKNKIDKLPTKGNLIIEFNEAVYDDGHFTKLSADIFKYIINEQIDEYAFRQVFYYKSHINMKDKERDRKFCFVGYETLSERLKISRSKVKDANEQLRKAKIIKIVKHELKHDAQYNENDELIFDRFNNHYYVNNKLH